jgi:hypothetical protein
MPFIVKIRTGNDAMKQYVDIADALDTVSDKLKNGQFCGKIMDINGNFVGRFGME